MELTPAQQKMNDAITAMRGDSGYDIVIVCTGNQSLEDYWQDRLEQGKGQVCPAGCHVVAVHEDWDGGAGNGLGTLYAYEKAVAKAKTFETPIDIDELMRNGSSVVLFHTAGKGTRLAPLPGSECNNKPGVKLPSTLKFGEQPTVLLTILEAVVIQTSLYAQRSKGRLSVYWGDQVFVPVESCTEAPTHHADILAQLGDFPTKEAWEANGFDSYGLIAVNADGDAAQVEKVSFDTAMEVLSTFGPTKAGPSLGSFSLSAALLTAFREEFRAELEAKVGKLDTDPHWWMPLTQPKDSYIGLMEKKGVSNEDSAAHFDRMAVFQAKFNEASPGPHGTKMFGAVGIGPSSGADKPYWWDYGQLKYYQQCNMKITEDSIEAQAYRNFLQVDSRVGPECTLGETTVCDASVVLATKAKSGSVTNSLVAKCNIGALEVTNSVLVNVTARSVKGNGLVLYNVVDNSEEGLTFADGEVRSDVFLPGEKVSVVSHLDIDSGKAWKDKVGQNTHSFEDVHTANQSACVITAAADADKAHSETQELHA